MSNIIDFTKTGGYRFKQFTLRKMQESYFQILNAFVAFCNIEPTGNYIISGCNVVGTNITDGWLYIDGELCQFSQTAGDLTTKIKKNVVIQSLGFKNGNNENVFRFTNAQVDAAGTILSDFTKVSPVFDSDYVQTENNFSDAWINFLSTIQANAEENVQSDWNVINPLSDAFIKNKPTILEVVKPMTRFIGVPDILSGAGSLVTINFPQVSTANYAVIGSFASQPGSIWNYDNTITWSWINPTDTHFQLALKEIGGASQSVFFDYMLIKIIS